MPVPFEPTASRMMQAASLKNHSALAADMGITPQALSNYKKRGEMPAHLVIEFALRRDISIDALVKTISMPAGVTSSTTNKDITLNMAGLSEDDAGSVITLLTILTGKDTDKASAMRMSLAALRDAQVREVSAHV